MVYGTITRLVLTVVAVLADTWVPSSPCPDIFQYQVDTTGQVYGLINIPALDPRQVEQQGIKLTVELGIDAVLPSVSVSLIRVDTTRHQAHSGAGHGCSSPLGKCFLD